LPPYQSQSKLQFNNFWINFGTISLPNKKRLWINLIAAEYSTAVTAKVDVYSLGVVLLELVTGRVANEAGADGHMATWAGRHCNRLMENTGDFSDIVDSGIPHRSPYLKEMAAMFRLGVDCTVKDPMKRPAMPKVLRRLDRGR
jgi:serine/threonine protein kinase